MNGEHVSRMADLAHVFEIDFATVETGEDGAQFVSKPDVFRFQFNERLMLAERIRRKLLGAKGFSVLKHEKATISELIAQLMAVRNTARHTDHKVAPTVAIIDRLIDELGGRIDPCKVAADTDRLGELCLTSDERLEAIVVRVSEAIKSTLVQSFESKRKQTMKRELTKLKRSCDELVSMSPEAYVVRFDHLLGDMPRSGPSKLAACVKQHVQGLKRAFPDAFIAVMWKADVHYAPRIGWQAHVVYFADRTRIDLGKIDKAIKASWGDVTGNAGESYSAAVRGGYRSFGCGTLRENAEALISSLTAMVARNEVLPLADCGVSSSFAMIKEMGVRHAQCA